MNISLKLLIRFVSKQDVIKQCTHWSSYSHLKISKPLIKQIEQIDPTQQEIISSSKIENSLKKKSFFVIFRGWFVYNLFSFNSILNNSDKLVKIGYKVLGKRIFEKVMKMSVYGHFVAGDNKHDIFNCISELKKNGIRCILDYSVEEDISDEQEISHETRSKGNMIASEFDENSLKEFKPTRQKGKSIKQASARTYFYQNEDRCDKNRDNFLECIKMAASFTARGEAFAAIKITALVSPKFLLSFGEIMQKKKDLFLLLSKSPDNGNSLHQPLPTISLESFSNGFKKLRLQLSENAIQEMYSEITENESSGCIQLENWLDHYNEECQLHKVLNKNEHTSSFAKTLSEDRQSDYKNLLDRLDMLAEQCRADCVRLMVDAEQSYFQRAIRYITAHDLMLKYNTDYPYIYNTQQCYLKSAFQSIVSDINYSKQNKFIYGVKLVRGAYTEQECARSKELGYSNPILPNIEATHDMYHEVMDICLKEVSSKSMKVMIASHNKYSIERAARQMNFLGLAPTSGDVTFGQLLGMCDYVSFPLAEAGYHVYKYTPYGPVMGVMPYLSRRAYENKALLKGADYERQILKQELKRRLFFKS